MNPTTESETQLATSLATPTVPLWEIADPLRYALVEWHRKGWRVCVTAHERVHRDWQTVLEAGTDLVCTCGEDKFGMLECMHTSAVRAFWHLRQPRIGKKVEPGTQPLPFPNVNVEAPKPARRKIVYSLKLSKTVRQGTKRYYARLEEAATSAEAIRQRWLRFSEAEEQRLKKMANKRAASVKATKAGHGAQ